MEAAITSRDNANIKFACAVRDSEKRRAQEGLFFAEGPKLCLELAKSCNISHQELHEMLRILSEEESK